MQVQDGTTLGCSSALPAQAIAWNVISTLRDASRTPRPCCLLQYLRMNRAVPIGIFTSLRGTESRAVAGSASLSAIQVLVSSGPACGHDWPVSISACRCGVRTSAKLAPDTLVVHNTDGSIPATQASGISCRHEVKPGASCLL